MPPMEQQRYLAWVASAFFLAAMVVGLNGALRDPRVASAPPLPLLAPTSPDPIPAAVEPDELAHLFGQPRVAAVEANAAPPRVEPVPGFRLKAVVVADPSPWSFAWIAAPDGSIRRVVVGESIDHVALVAVDRFPSRAVLRRESDGFEWTLDASATTVSAAAPTTPALPTRAALPGLREVGPNHFEVPKATVAALVGRFDTIAREVRIQPQFAGSKIEGMRVASLKQGSVLGALGIQAGDVILRFDGLAADDLAGLTAAAARLPSGGDVTVDVLRQGRPMKLRITVD